jgi:hypothetical protein
MMKKIIAMITVVAFVMGSTFAFAGGVPREAGHGKGVPKGQEVHHSVRYRRLMRDIEKEYQQGSLTRTEYIQRKRQIKSMFK